ncbi:MAG TPA: hypothetical protein VFI31_09630 [Pirellulales bacterium]|nr:hypothetical protein [Pirellulales bacterium]
MSPPDSAPARCPECGAAVRMGGDRCWLCGAKLPHAAAEQPTPPAAGREIVEATLAQQETAATFSLTSLFMVTTLVAVGAGVFAAAPGLGIAFAIVATPALIRTIVVTSKRKAQGVVQTPGKKIAAFLASIGIMLLVVVSIGIALLTACLTACAGLAVGGDKGIVPGMYVGGAAGLVLTGCLMWLIWRWQRKM